MEPNPDPSQAEREYAHYMVGQAINLLLFEIQSGRGHNIGPEDLEELRRRREMVAKLEGWGPQKRALFLDNAPEHERAQKSPAEWEREIAAHSPTENYYLEKAKENWPNQRRRNGLLAVAYDSYLDGAVAKAHKASRSADDATFRTVRNQIYGVKSYRDKLLGIQLTKDQKEELEFLETKEPGKMVELGLTDAAGRLLSLKQLIELGLSRKCIQDLHDSIHNGTPYEPDHLDRILTLVRASGYGKGHIKRMKNANEGRALARQIADEYAERAQMDHAS